METDQNKETLNDINLKLSLLVLHLSEIQVKSWEDAQPLFVIEISI